MERYYMEYVIHLTDSCNLNCTYCYEKKKPRVISFENIKALCDYEISTNPKYSVIIFYGGEPLLQKDLIKQTIDYINSKRKNINLYLIMFHLWLFLFHLHCPNPSSNTIYHKETDSIMVLLPIHECD